MHVYLSLQIRDLFKLSLSIWQYHHVLKWTEVPGKMITTCEGNMSPVLHKGIIPEDCNTYKIWVTVIMINYI